ncbi:MAG: hypothetical protein WCP06_03150 [Verrucomicrobiota bacterium]
MKPKNCHGSALVFALIVLLVLSSVGFLVLEATARKYHNVAQATGWQESLMLAESGIDLGMAELRKTISSSVSAPWQKPVWTTGTAAGTPFFSGTMEMLTAGVKVGTVQVYIDAPPTLVDSGSHQYYRVRATGTQFIGGPARSTGESADTALRMISLHANRFTHQAISTPQASRTIEVIAKPENFISSNGSPIGAFAILAASSITMVGNALVDSYDSTNPAESDSNGQYAASKSGTNGNVYTNGAVMNLNGNAIINGSIGLNGGDPNTTGNATVTGQVDPHSYTVIAPVSAPGWIGTPDQNVGMINATTTIATSATGVKHINASGISLSGKSNLHITGTNVKTYVEIYVNGNISEAGQGQIIVDPNVIVTIWVTGNVTLTGQGLVNNSGSYNRPGNFTINGIQPQNGNPPTYNLAGNGELSAVVNAPSANITLTGGGTSGAFYGSIIGNTVTLSGGANLHYDESLGNGAATSKTSQPTDYVICSWFEDTLFNCDQ